MATNGKIKTVERMATLPINIHNTDMRGGGRGREEGTAGEKGEVITLNQNFLLYKNLQHF
jgi:hypothetical protein